MGDKIPYRHYSLEDIERYLGGRMSSLEMHEMERAALEDPFLSDALEGYRTIGFEDARKDLDDISAAMLPPHQGAKVVAFATKLRYWWRVAAIIVLLGGIATVTWFLTTTPGSNDHPAVAVLKHDNTRQIDTLHNPSVPLTKQEADTSPVVNTPGNATRNASTKRDAPDTLHTKTLPADHDYARTSIAAGKNPDTSSSPGTGAIADATSVSRLKDIENRTAAAQVAPPSGETPPVATGESLHVFSGRITDDHHMPLPYVFVINGSEAVMTDTNGYFQLNAPGAELPVTVSSVGYVPVQTRLKNDRPNNILIRPDSGLTAHMDIKPFGKTKESERAKKNGADSVYPSGGWESFQAYVYKKLNKPFDSTTEISGDVQLEFLVDDEGNPYSFSVLHSVNDASALEAIEIIREGPKWITSEKNRKGKITIRFHP